MVKYLSIPMSGTNQGSRLLKVMNLIMCETSSTTETKVNMAGPNTNILATITHTAMGANDHALRIAITDAMAEAMKTSYTNSSYDLDLTGVNAASGSQVTISDIVLS